MAVHTAWQAVTARLGPLPPACKSLTTQELTFLLESVDNAGQLREQEVEDALRDMFRHVPPFLHKTLRKLLLS